TAQGGTCSSYGAQPPAPAGSSYLYTATCLPGFHAKWNQFAYKTTVPSASDVLFKMSTAPLLPDGGAGTFTTPVAVAHPATPLISDPAICPISGPSPCPKNLSTILGATAAANQVLKLELTLTATTALPTVDAWQVTFSCVAAE